MGLECLLTCLCGVKVLIDMFKWGQSACWYVLYMGLECLLICLCEVKVLIGMFKWGQSACWYVLYMDLECLLICLHVYIHISLNYTCL